jgi:hypothetical protein
VAIAERFENTEMLFLKSVAGVTFLFWKRGGDVEGVERRSYPKESSECVSRGKSNVRRLLKGQTDHQEFEFGRSSPLSPVLKLDSV